MEKSRVSQPTNRIIAVIATNLWFRSNFCRFFLSSLISQTAAGNRANLNKPFSSSKRPRFQNDAMCIVISIHFSYGRLRT